MKLFLFYFFSIFVAVPTAWSQKPIEGDLKTMLFLGRNPYQEVSNTSADNLFYMLYYKIQPAENPKIGYMDTKGRTVVKPIYNMGSDYYGDYANIIKDSIFGYIDKRGKETLFPEYDLVFFSYSNTGIVKKNGKYGLIDRKGVQLTAIDYKNIILFGFHHFKALRDDKETRILDETGAIVMVEKPPYDIKSPYFFNDSLLIYEVKDAGKSLQGLMTSKHRIVLDPIYEKIYPVNSNEFFIVKNKSKWGGVNTLGSIIIPMDYEEISTANYEGNIAAKKEGKWGYINNKNEMVIPFEYDEANPFFQDLAFVRKDELYGCIDSKNKVKIPFYLEKPDFPMFSKALNLFKENGLFGFRNRKGQTVIRPIYENAYPFINDMAYVEKNGKCGYINTKGKVVIPIQYRQLWFENEGLIRFVE